MGKHAQWMKTRKAFTVVGMALGGVVIAAAMALILGFAVMWLWNWLMPDIFGLTKITFWQAWGLVVLSHILFKSFPHTTHHSHDEYWKRKFQHKFFPEKGTETGTENESQS